MKIKKHPGLKKANKSNRLTKTKKFQLAASSKGSWYNQADVVSKPSSLKDIGASQMKITASAAEEFIDELPDSGDSNTSASPSESEFEDAGDDPAIFAVVDRLKNLAANFSSQNQWMCSRTRLNFSHYDIALQLR